MAPLAPPLVIGIEHDVAKLIIHLIFTMTMEYVYLVLFDLFLQIPWAVLLFVYQWNINMM